MSRNKLAEIRRAQNKSILDFYNETGIPVCHFADLERSRVLPVVSEMAMLAQVYGITEQEIFEICNPHE